MLNAYYWFDAQNWKGAEFGCLKICNYSTPGLNSEEDPSGEKYNTWWVKRNETNGDVYHLACSPETNHSVPEGQQIALVGFDPEQEDLHLGKWKLQMRQQSVRQQSGQDCCPRYIYIYVPSCSTGCVCILSPVLVTSSMLSIPQVWKCGQWCSIQSLKGLVMTLSESVTIQINKVINTSNQQISNKSNQQIFTLHSVSCPQMSADSASSLNSTGRFVLTSQSSQAPCEKRNPMMTAVQPQWCSFSRPTGWGCFVDKEW